MDTTPAVTGDPQVGDYRADIARLTAEVAAEQHLLDGLDDAIGRMYESRKTAVNRLWESQEKLARLKHYAALALQAKAARS